MITMAAADPMTDPLYELQVPPQLVQRIISIESGARELAARTVELGQLVPSEKARIDNLIDQLENKTGPALAQMELNMNKLADQVEEKKKTSSDLASNLLQILNTMSKDFADRVVPIEQGLKALQDSTALEFNKLRQEIADVSRWKVGQQQLASEFENIRTSISAFRIEVTAGDDKYKESIQKMESHLAEARKDITQFQLKVTSGVSSSSPHQRNILDVKHTLNQDRIGSDRKVYRTWPERMKNALNKYDPDLRAIRDKIELKRWDKTERSDCLE